MKNKLIKTFVSLLTIFIMFFIGSNKVNAEYDKCVYYTNSAVKVDNINIDALAAVKTGKMTEDGDIIGRGQKIGLEYLKNIGSNFLMGSYSESNAGTPVTAHFRFSSSDFEDYIDSNGCPDFVKVYYAGGGKGIEVSSASKDEFLKNSYYSGKVRKTKYDSVYYFKIEDDIKDEKKSIYLIKRGAESKYKEFKYPNNTYKKLLDSGVSDDEAKKRLKACGIDGNEYNIVEQYYQDTKDSILTKDKNFDIWFNLISRYMLEDNPEKFFNYFKSTNNVSNENDSNLSEQTKLCLEMAKKITEVDKIDNKKDDLNENTPVCNYYCYSENSLAQTECKKSDVYKSCVNCYTIKSSTDQAKCLEPYKEVSDKNKTAFDNKHSTAYQDLKEALLSVADPTLKIKFKGYKVKCEDVVIFHDLYIILSIAAPILVIIFGSLDYAKAVFASDVEKMEKSKKKFPKRVALVVLFMLVPVVINLILNLYSKSTDIDVNSNLMYCIIKG